MLVRCTLTTTVVGFALVALTGITRAQLGGLSTQEWTTSGADAQRSHWIRKDALISPASMSSGKFGYLWKLKVNNPARPETSFSNPVLVNNAMGYKGFRSLTLLLGGSNKVFAVDNDFGSVYWEKAFETAVPRESTAACPGGMTAAASRNTNSDPSALAGRSPLIRSPFKSALSEPGAGASVDSAPFLPGSAARANTPAPAPQAPAASGPVAPGRGGGRGRGPAFPTGAQPITMLSSDGVLHFVSPVTAKELLKPVQFLPPNAHATDLTAVNGKIYTATVSECGGVPNAVWAVDPTAENPEVISWRTNGASVVGTLAFGADGTVYAAIGDDKAAAAGGYANAIVALEPETLSVKDWVSLPGARFAGAPVVLRSRGKELLAAAAGDGRIFLMEAASLGGADHKTPLEVTPPSTGARPKAVGGALATWEDARGVSWLLTPSATPSPSARFAESNGPVTNGAIAAYKVRVGAKPALEPAWISKDLTTPLTPVIVNGVIFALSSGEYQPDNATLSAGERTLRSMPAMLYALDAATGKEVWNSGQTMTSFVRRTGLSASPGQVYVVTSDSTIYCFGMPYERQ
jgi:outer membrane protein assembly factor BamB